MTEQPSISAVIPTFNREKLIEFALESTARQRPACTEVIVVDDGSTDRTRAVVEHWEKQHPELPVRYLYQENAGVGAARNRGWRAASGEWIAFLDSDDRWLADHNALLWSAVQHFPNANFIFGNGRIVHLSDAAQDRATKTTFDALPHLSTDPYQVMTTDGILYRQLLSGSFIPVSGTILRRSVLERVGGFDVTYRYGEDKLCWLKCCVQGDAILCHAIVNDFCKHNENATNRRNRKAKRRDKLRMLTLLIANSVEFRLSSQTRAELRSEKQQRQYKAVKAYFKECAKLFSARSAKKC